MKITSISIQTKNPNRVNISVDGTYRFSLDVYQVTELGIRNGAEVTEEKIAQWEEESAFGKLYARALEYCLMRPHSAKEVRDYLWRKTLTRRIKVGGKREAGSGERRSALSQVIEKPGVSKEITDRVYDRLMEKGYIDDEKFTRYWLENRNLTKGASQRKLVNELRGKGVEQGIIERLLPSSARSDNDELQKVLIKRARRYDDDNKLAQYLMRQGFSYDDIRMAIDRYRTDQAGETEHERD